MRLPDIGKIRLIACDLDGTLLLDGAQSLEPEECMAFGDNENDREMLELAGFPVTMDTSVETVFGLGRYHTGRVEDMLERILSGSSSGGI